MYNKYHNKKTRYKGRKFDSKKEAQRYAELQLLERAGKISGLRCQVNYLLIPAQYRDGKCIERNCQYRADFVYWQDGQLVVEDVKGVKTDVYRLKKKLMLLNYGIQIKEV